MVAAMRALHIFTHIPRTAGTTVNAMLQDAFPDQPTLGAMSVKAFHESLSGMSAGELDEIVYVHGHIPYGVHRAIDPQQRRETVYITLLRNPVERVISQYNYILSQPTHPNYAQIGDSLSSYCAFLKSHLNDNLQTRFLSADLSAYDDASLRAYRFRTAADCLDLATERLEATYVFGLQEDFERALGRISERVRGPTAPASFMDQRHLPSTQAQEPTPSEIDAVRELESVDIELYERAKKIIAAQQGA